MDADAPSDHNQALLARLNALKHSNVSFGPEQPAIEAASQSQETPESLIEHYQRLHSVSAVKNEDTGVAQPNTDSDDEPPSPTIEDLLAELGPEDQYTVDDNDLREADQLLAEAKRALPEDAQAQRIDCSIDLRGDALDKHTAPPKHDQDEETEAEKTLRRILDEAKLEEQEPITPAVTSGHPDISRSFPSAPLDSFASLEFPSTPVTPLESVHLPSVPTTAPYSRKSRDKSKGFSDEEIDSWCIICCANATVKCFGCDGDLYCWGCWREGHTGDDVGLEEKNHVWCVATVLFLLNQCEFAHHSFDTGITFGLLSTLWSALVYQ